MEVFKGHSLRLNAPEFYRDPAFVAWLNNGVPKFSWHKGGLPDEWSDVVVLVDPSLSGEGTDSDMPDHIWEAIVNACRQAYGQAMGGVREHITVRLTNVSV
jgi:hypothetical protein